jgi:hypothetical protein
VQRLQRETEAFGHWAEDFRAKLEGVMARESTEQQATRDELEFMLREAANGLSVALQHLASQSTLATAHLRELFRLRQALLDAIQERSIDGESADAVFAAMQVPGQS